MVAIRDLKCSQDVEKMTELRRFEEEFNVYGISYKKENQIWHQVSSDPIELFEFIEHAVCKNIYPTVINQWINRVLVPAGEEEYFLLETKQSLAKKQKRIYTSVFFDHFYKFANTKNSNAAYPCLKQLQEDLIGRFDREKLNLFDKLLLYSLEAKKITSSTYHEFKNWVESQYQQMEDDIIIKKDLKRTYSGIKYYDENNTIKYYLNAKPEIVYFKREQLILENKIVTPIWTKNYWFQHIPNGADVRKQFLSEMNSHYSEKIMSLFSYIHTLPSAIPNKEYQDWMSELEQNHLTEQFQVATFYANIWNVI